MENKILMDLPTGKLLDKFGSGGHAPGSGSAAALMGVLSAKLISTVGALSLSRPAYRKSHAKIELIKNEIDENFEPELRRLFEEDSKAFDEVIKLRNARNQALEEREKRRFGELALDKLEYATEIPHDICRHCLRLIDHGVVMFDIGFKSARGDTGAAVSAAVAGAMSGIFVINLNLRSFRSRAWAEGMRERCDSLHKILEVKQLEAFGRVMTLREEEIGSMNFGFDDLGNKI
jgi:formiminotetrahydrofolate cyclodeaminase